MWCEAAEVVLKNYVEIKTHIFLTFVETPSTLLTMLVRPSLARSKRSYPSLSWCHPSFMTSKSRPKLETMWKNFRGSWTSQSLEFVAETRILVEMKIENRGEKIFSAEKQIDKHTFFQTDCRCSRKYGNHSMNECEFASKIERCWSYCSWTFAYFKLISVT